MKAVLISALLALCSFTALAADKPADDSKAEAKNLLQPTNDPDSWVFELNDSGKGEMSADGDAIVFHTTATTGTDWHVQAYQTGLDLKDGQDYIIKFQMKSPDKVQLLLVGQIHQEDWHEIGLHEEIQPGEKFKVYKYEFTARDTVDKNNRIGFVLGIDKGAVSVKEMTLTEKPSKP